MIGRGGMAAVYSAHDLQLDRSVAVKIFAPGEANDDTRRRAETQLLARLNHPNLVTLYDAHLAAPGTDEPSYIVMELVDGPSLRDELARGPLPAEEVAVLAAELAEALVAVHAAGVVHRDLKPANILLALTGLPSPPYRGKLADFGIAHLVGSERITTHGMVVGTAAYLSPEQAHGAEPGPPADIYSLGLVLIESLTGHRPFPGTAAESFGARLLRDPVIPSNLPPGWAQLLTEMTARDAAARPEALDVAVRARAYAGELAGWAPGEDETVDLPGPDFAAAAAAAAAAVGAAAGAAAVAAPGSDEKTLVMAAPPTMPLTVDDESTGASRRRTVIGVAIAALGVLAVAGMVAAGILVGANAQNAEPSSPPASSVAPVAPVSSVPPTTPPTIRPAPSVKPSPAPVQSDNGNNDKGGDKGKGKGNKEKGNGG
ncbi:serine/threonine-protein kinase [Leifsonia sp. NPDC058248]|uniref:serine/threonine-protein kinase n=1 Tax=Leifsonia sp. NPDC058248 TaxID=3346402 RepID=UPI0036DC15C6